MQITEFANFLETELERLELSQNAAASILDISPRKLWGWLNGCNPLPSYCEERGARVIFSEMPDPAPRNREAVERSSKPERSAIEERSQVPPERPSAEEPPEDPKSAPRVALFPPAPRPPKQPGKK